MTGNGTNRHKDDCKEGLAAKVGNLKGQDVSQTGIELCHNPSPTALSAIVCVTYASD
jgi:hypothetical protein